MSSKPQDVLRRLQRNHTIKLQPARCPHVPDFFDRNIFGGLQNEHDYLARWIASTTPGFWAEWVAACTEMAADTTRLVRVFSGHDVAYFIRRRVAPQQRVQGQKYRVASAHHPYLMRLVVRSCPELQEFVQFATLTLSTPELNDWVYGTCPLLPLPR